MRGVFIYAVFIPHEHDIHYSSKHMQTSALRILQSLDVNNSFSLTALAGGGFIVIEVPSFPR